MALPKTEIPHPVYERIGRSIRELRTRPGGPKLSQDELARAISLTRASVANIERGRQKILAHTLLEIAAALKVAPAELLPQIDTCREPFEYNSAHELSTAARDWIARATERALG